LRNDGAAPRTDEHGVVTRGSFVDVSTEAGLPTDELAWCVTEDFDGDNDVDLLLGGPSAVHLLDNLRAGKFADVTSKVFPGAHALPQKPRVADLDGDSRPDVLEPGGPSWLLRQRADGTLAAEPAQHVIPAGSAPVALDVDLDGTTDVFWTDASAALEGV